MILQIKYIIFFITTVTILSSCAREPDGNIAETNTFPEIDPDYSGIIIPYNIAPLNFRITEKASAFFVRISADGKNSIEIRSRDGIIKIPVRKWKRVLNNNKSNDLIIQIFTRNENGSWSKYISLMNHIAPEPVDQFLTYRLLYPGYESWKEIRIVQRNLENFHENSIIENSIAEESCVNCHSYNNGRTDDFLFHMRGSRSGTYFYRNGEFRKFNLKPEEMKNGAVYPRWHPSGKFVAFSSNRIVQQFHSALNKKVEVSDLESSLVIYDVDMNEMREIKLAEKEKYMDTYPEWSPDGRYLYLCRALQVPENFDYQQIHYDLFRVKFDPATMSFGQPELIFNASSINKSVSFPRISPDGRYIVITLHDYGCFPIWHKEADLWSIDLETLQATPIQANSDQTDSYHSWSSNGRWLVLSSKRTDGLTARFFITYFDEGGNFGKPFILPQEDPGFYHRYLKSFNLPEFSTLEISINPGTIRRNVTADAVQAKWADK